MKNAFGMWVYFEEYIFPVFFLLSLEDSHDNIKCSAEVMEFTLSLLFQHVHLTVTECAALFLALTWTRGGFWYRHGTYSITIPRLWAYSSTSASWIQEQLLPASCRRGWFPSQSRPSPTAVTAAADAGSICPWQSTSQAKVFFMLLSCRQTILNISYKPVTPVLAEVRCTCKSVWHSSCNIMGILGVVHISRWGMQPFLVYRTHF